MIVVLFPGSTCVPLVDYRRTFPFPLIGWVVCARHATRKKTVMKQGFSWTDLSSRNDLIAAYGDIRPMGTICLITSRVCVLCKEYGSGRTTTFANFALNIFSAQILQFEASKDSSKLTPVFFRFQAQRLPIISLLIQRRRFRLPWQPSTCLCVSASNTLPCPTSNSWNPSNISKWGS